MNLEKPEEFSVRHTRRLGVEYLPEGRFDGGSNVTVQT